MLRVLDSEAAGRRPILLATSSRYVSAILLARHHRNEQNTEARLIGGL